MEGLANAQREGREGERSPAQAQGGAEEPQTGEAPLAVGERVGPGNPPVATRFRPGRSGNPRGRPKRRRHLGAVVARALSERVAVEETDGRVKRISKLEATVRAIVDGAAKGDARAIKLLFALIKADERALAEAEGARPEGLASEADAIVIAELRRRLGAGGAAPHPNPRPASGARGGPHPGALPQGERGTRAGGTRGDSG